MRIKGPHVIALGACVKWPLVVFLHLELRNSTPSWTNRWKLYNDRPVLCILKCLESLITFHCSILILSRNWQKTTTTTTTTTIILEILDPNCIHWNWYRITYCSHFNIELGLSRLGITKKPYNMIHTRHCSKWLLLNTSILQATKTLASTQQLPIASKTTIKQNAVSFQSQIQFLK